MSDKQPNQEDLDFLADFTNNEEGIRIFAEVMAERLGGKAEDYKPYLASCALLVSVVIGSSMVEGMKEALLLPGSIGQLVAAIQLKKEARAVARLAATAEAAAKSLGIDLDAKMAAQATT